jgi:hypothetical protein
MLEEMGLLVELEQQVVLVVAELVQQERVIMLQEILQVL